MSTINQQRIVDIKTVEISDQEKIDNKESAKMLEVGQTYSFDPVMNTSGVPQNVTLSGLPDFDFQSGEYLGMQDDRLVFEGYPIDAPEKTIEWKFYFFVSCVKGGVQMKHMKK